MTDEERQKFIQFLRYYRENSEYGKSWADKAADEIEALAEELANANRLLEIGRRRSLEKSGGLEVGNND